MSCLNVVYLEIVIKLGGIMGWYSGPSWHKMVQNGPIWNYFIQKTSYFETVISSKKILSFDFMQLF